MTMPNNLHCPQCGAALQQPNPQTKLLTCDYCSSTLLIEQSGLSYQAISSKLENKQSLLSKKAFFHWYQQGNQQSESQHYQAQGYIQFSHEEGIRTEWWVTDEQGESWWLSEEDENCFLLQDTNTTEIRNVRDWDSLQPNTQLRHDGKDWIVTEKKQLTYHGFQGELPHLPLHSAPLKYTYLTTQNAETLVLIFDTNPTNQQSLKVRHGFWLDPFELTVKDK
jgi:DNA-directed RNA polymerase subunit RPC12/RpoP